MHLISGSWDCVWVGSGAICLSRSAQWVATFIQAFEFYLKGAGKAPLLLHEAAEVVCNVVKDHVAKCVLLRVLHGCKDGEVCSEKPKTGQHNVDASARLSSRMHANRCY